MVRLAQEVTSVISRLCDEINFTRPASDEALELCAALLALQDAGLHPAEAAEVVTEVRVGAIGDGDNRGDDGSLDAIAVLVGDACVTPTIDRAVLKTMLANATSRSIQFVLVQATGVEPTAAGTPALKDKLNSFLVGIQLFLSAPSTAAGMNGKVRRWLAFRDEILSLLDDLELSDTRLSLRVTLVWPRPIRLEEIHHHSVRAVSALAAQRLDIPPERCRIDVWNIDEFMAIATRAAEPRSLSIPATQLYDIAPSHAEGVRNYSGYIGAGALVRAARVSGRPGARLDSGLFVDNVRDYLGAGAQVNAEIMATLATPRGRSIFHLLSNGVALLSRAERRSPDGQEIELVNAQIINGCQTTHALDAAAGAHGDAILDDVIVPVRIVITENEELIDQIILGLNRQHPVEALSLLSRRPYMMRLSACFVEVAGSGPKAVVHFARREGEHSAVPDRNRVVTLQEVLFAYHSAFSSSPHAMPGPMALIEMVRKEKLLHVHQAPGFYVAAGLMHAAVMKELHRQRRLDARRQWGARNQALHAMRLLTDKAATATPPFDAKGDKAAAYLDAVMPHLIDTALSQALAAAAIGLVLKVTDDIKKQAAKARGSKVDIALSSLASQEMTTEAVRNEAAGASA